MNIVTSFLNAIRLYFYGGIAISVGIVLSHAACAQTTMSLSNAINKALLNRKNIVAGRYDQVIRRLQKEALYRKYWPQINAEYTYLYNPILQTSILPIGVFNPSYPADATKSVQFGTKWSQTVGLTLNQPLIDVAINRQIEEAELQERIAGATQAQTEYELAYTVAQVYIDILLQETKIKSAVADTSRTWISCMLLQNKFDQKRLLKSELNKGKINHNSTIQLYKTTVAQMIAAKVFLLFLIGENNFEQSDIVVDTSLLNNELLSMESTRLSNGSIPELQALQLRGDLNGAQLRTEKGKHLPTLNLKGYLGANQYTNNFDPIAANTWFGLSYVGIDIKYPLLFGEDKRKKIQQLQFQSTQYYQQKDDKVAQYSKDAVVAKIKIEGILSELKTQQESIALSAESIAIFQSRVAEGEESAYTLNLEEADLQKLTADYQSNKKRYWLYFLDYLRATGKMEILWTQ